MGITDIFGLQLKDQGLDFLLKTKTAFSRQKVCHNMTGTHGMTTPDIFLCPKTFNLDMPKPS